MNRIPIAAFNHRSKAEPLHKRLVDAGVRAEIHDELRLEKLWFVSQPAAGVRIEPPPDQFQRARQLRLDLNAADTALRNATHFLHLHPARAHPPHSPSKPLTSL